MYGESFKPPNRGEPISARFLQAVARAVEGLLRLKAGPGLRETNVHGMRVLSLVNPDTQPVRALRAPSGGIPARSGLTCGSATCTFYNEDPTNYQLSDETATVYNDYRVAVANNGEIRARYRNGRWWVLTEECGTTTGTSTGGSLSTGIGAGSSGTTSGSGGTLGGANGGGGTGGTSNLFGGGGTTSGGTTSGGGVGVGISIGIGGGTSTGTGLPAPP